MSLVDIMKMKEVRYHNFFEKLICILLHVHLESHNVFDFLTGRIGATQGLRKSQNLSQIRTNKLISKAFLLRIIPIPGSLFTGPTRQWS